MAKAEESGKQRSSAPLQLTPPIRAILQFVRQRAKAAERDASKSSPLLRYDKARQLLRKPHLRLILTQRKIAKVAETGSQSSLASDYYEPSQSRLMTNLLSKTPRIAKAEGKSPPRVTLLTRPRSWSLLSNLLSRSPADDLVFLERQISPTMLLYPHVFPLVVLLVTPSRLELLNDEINFIPKLFPLLFSNPDQGQLDVLVAVVDKIPYLTKRHLPVEDEEYQNSNGCEGISVLIGKSKEVAPDLWHARDWVGERESDLVGARPPTVNNLNNMDHAALSFLFRPSAATMASIAANNLKGPFASYDLRLPVSNTLFQNGQTSTLYAERWKPSQSATGFSRVRRALLPAQNLHLGGLVDDKPSDGKFELNTKLKPIVPPRVIAAAMGNIIRQIYSGSFSNPEETAPASKELEEAVSQSIKNSQDPIQKVDIWALVTPRKYRVSEPRVGPNLQPNLQQSIKNGSRLHKVLSGGGGWGIKEGLLALDPDCDYDCPEHEMQMGSGEDQIGDLAGAQVCRDIVKPGDLVSFFVPTPLTDRPNNLVGPQEGLNSWKAVAPSAANFGTLPSTMDAMPNSSSASGQPSMPFNHVLALGHFGMLSEHGMSIKIHNHSFDDSGNCGAEKLGAVVQTKLDAPYALFSTVPSPGLTTTFTERLPFQQGTLDPSLPAKDELDTSTGILGTMSDLAQSLGLIDTANHPTAPPENRFRLRKHFRKRLA